MKKRARRKKVKPTEAWFHQNHPGAFPADEDGREAVRLFKYRVEKQKNGAKVETDIPSGIASDVLFAEVLSRVGSPQAPLVWIKGRGMDAYAAYVPAEGIYKVQTPAEVEDLVSQKLKEVERHFRPNVAVARAVNELRNWRFTQRVRMSLAGVGVEPSELYEYNFRHLHVRDGVLDLKRAKLRRFSARRRQLFRLEVSLKDAQRVPREFLAMLSRLFTDPADREVVLDCMAWSLVGSPGPTILIISGRGGAGKSTLIKVWSFVVGEHRFGELRPAHFGERFESARWRGRLLLHVPECTTKELVGSGKVLKQLSGKDLIEPEAKNSTATSSFVPRALPVLTTNCRLHLPVDTDEDAWRRRVKPVVADGPPPATKRDEFASELFEREGGAILWYLAERLQALRAEGERPLSLAQAGRLEVMLSGDPVKFWVAAHVEPAKGSRVLVKDLVAAIEPVLEEWGERLSEGALQESLAKAMQDIHNVSRSNSTAGGRGFRNVRLKSAG